MVSGRGARLPALSDFAQTDDEVSSDVLPLDQLLRHLHQEIHQVDQRTEPLVLGVALGEPVINLLEDDRQLESGKTQIIMNLIKDVSPKNYSIMDIHMIWLILMVNVGLLKIFEQQHLIMVMY